MPHNSREREQRLEAKARARILEKQDFLILDELVNRFDRKSELSRTRLEKWEQERRIFSIDHDGDIWYPSYAFSSGGELLAGLKDVLVVLSASKDSWGFAFWLGSPNSLLGGALPRDRLLSDLGSVLSAAVDEVHGASHG